MRPQKVEDLDMLNGLMSVFRSKGYDGASLIELATATGLKKASLYHRFPGGKKDMSAAVLAHLHSWNNKNVYDVLTDDTENFDERIDTVISNMREIYKDGTEVCVFRSLSLDSGIALFGDQIQEGIQLFIKGFEVFGLEKGMSVKEARDNANQTFIDIQGSLVLSKSLNITEPFLTVLEKIKNRYT
ncbi:TetR/AcrR family transcriptional regulator [uncultured Aquimarina sp.]|uniref:TetR/AcrR family transcriptional regulator n=1 Tax=uncultured Aquimarina sp. TaxID=575652 RepID=UPI0026294230|nr:TetR/AcrR family transcriptional regulator [uncultured Aquimarina sp.]